MSGPMSAADGLGLIVEALARSMPDGARGGCEPITALHVDALTPAESAAVARAVERRRQEFATGRALVRRLLGRPVELLVGEDRSPRWPPGVRGSIAHDACFVVAVVSEDPALRALGIDLEPVGALDARDAALVRRSDETGIDAHLAFTAKEAVYKAWRALGGGFLEFHDVRLSMEAEPTEGNAASFLAEVFAAVGPVSTTEVAESTAATSLVLPPLMAGRVARASGRWLAVVAVPADGG